MKTPVITTLLGLALGASVTLVAAPSAMAASDISIAPRIVQPNVVINSTACRQVPISVGYSSSGTIELIDVAMEVWRGDTNVGTASLYGDNTSSSGTLDGYYFYCPYEGLGAFRVGPSRINWLDGNFDSQTASDGQNVYFTARQASRFKNAKVVRSGSTRTFSAKAQFFNVNLSRWDSVRRGTKVKLERSTGGAWRSVKSARVGKSGAVKVSTKTSKKYTYRLTIGSTSKVWGGSSKSIRK